MKTCSHKGALGEMFVAQWLLSHNLEVFLNIPAVGPADLVAWNTETGHMLAIDVKTTDKPAYVTKAGEVRHTFKIPHFREDGVAQIGYVIGEAAPIVPAGFWEALGMSDT
jgi:glucose dehydrogenase